jgi:cellulose synthase/poly-beta-1,6-N-acetylglucosamine synthase-like glycosyltransferase
LNPLDGILLGADRAIIWYFLGLNSFYALLILISVPELWRHWKITNSDNLTRYLSSEALPPISVLMPAYNMEAGIIESVRAQLDLRYPQHEVIVVNDGSSDGTLERVSETFDLYEVPPAIPTRIPTQPVRTYYRSRREPTLLLIDKENGGKSDALNAAINAARYPLVVAVDGDTIIEPDALIRLARTFLGGSPVAAAGGTIRVANGCDVHRARVTRTGLSTRFLAAVQVPEYLRAFLFGRLGWNRLGGNLIVSGAFGLFQRRFLLEIGGYATGNVVEDLDLIVRLHKHLLQQRLDYRISFIPDPLAWTEVPSDLRTLGRQRERWHRGLVRTMLTHRRMLFNPRYGTIGLVVYPFFFFGEMLAPVVELFGYVITVGGLATGVLNVEFAVLFLAVALGYQMMLSIWAVILEEATFRVYDRRKDFYRLLLYALVEPFGYRQLTVLWRLRGVFNALRGLTHWGEMQREGFGGKPDGATNAPGAAEVPGAAGAMEAPGAADVAA